MIFILYKLYLNEVKIEGFADSPVQSLGGVDDANSINTLAQIARKLMDKGLTVPGDMSITGNTTVTGNMAVNGILSPAHSVWHTSTDGKQRIHYSNNSHSFYKTADAHFWKNRDDTDRMVLDHDANLRVVGGLTVSGRNILAELDILNKNTLKIGQKIRFKVGPDYGGSQYITPGSGSWDFNDPRAQWMPIA